jgi:hypothetical protein
MLRPALPMQGPAHALPGERGQDLDEEVRAVVPANLRREGDSLTLGNRFDLMFLGLPLGIPSPLARLREITLRTRALKEGGHCLSRPRLRSGRGHEGR